MGTMSNNDGNHMSDDYVKELEQNIPHGLASLPNDTEPTAEVSANNQTSEEITVLGQPLHSTLLPADKSTSFGINHIFMLVIFCVTFLHWFVYFFFS